MAIRSSAGEMDFEYENRTGPVDHNSPFLTATHQHLPQPQQQGVDTSSKKRLFNSLESPKKSQAFPSLRDPTAQTKFYFSQPSQYKELPSAPIPSNPAFSTPRSKIDTIYDSSEVDASSPECNADSDATPDRMWIPSGVSKVTGVLSRVLTPEKKLPSLSRITMDSSRNELARSNYSLHAEKKIRKKRSKISERILRRRKDNQTLKSDEAEEENPATPSAGSLASIFSFIEMHPGLPHILSFYAQLLLNVFLVFAFIYLVYSFWATIRADVEKKAEEAMVTIRTEMAQCVQAFVDNKCGADTRVPALESLCNEWHRCARQDPRAVGRARISAHTFAEIFNSFIEPISWKAMIFTFILVFGCVGVSNFAFGFFRNKSRPLPHPEFTPSFRYMGTPHHVPNESTDYQFAPYHSPMRRFGDPTSLASMENGSPMRRLQY